jgi:hypothetical protein
MSLYTIFGLNPEEKRDFCVTEITIHLNTKEMFKPAEIQYFWPYCMFPFCL